MSMQEIPNSYRRIEKSPKTPENELIKKDRSTQSWKERLKELCLSGDYPLIQELISQLLIDQKREWVEEKVEKLLDIPFSTLEREHFIEEVIKILEK